MINIHVEFENVLKEKEKKVLELEMESKEKIRMLESDNQFLNIYVWITKENESLINKQNDNMQQTWKLQQNIQILQTYGTLQ